MRIGLFIDEVFVKGKVTNAAKSLLENYAAKIKQSRPLRLKDLERYVLLANDLPGIKIKTVLSPSSSALGATDLTFVVAQKRLAVSVNYDNYGTRYLDPYHLGANLAVNSLLGSADKLGAYILDTPV